MRKKVTIIELSLFKRMVPLHPARTVCRGKFHFRVINEKDRRGIRGRRRIYDIAAQSATVLGCDAPGCICRSSKKRQLGTHNLMMQNRCL